MAFFRPWPLSVAAILAWIVFCWIAIANMDYRQGQTALEARTGSYWFVLGLPIIVGMGCAFALPFTWLARRVSQVLAWILLTLASGLLWGSAIPGLTPEARLAGIIGPKAFKQAIVERLIIQDSFGDGTSVSGVLSGPPGLMKLIIDHASLEQDSSNTLNNLKILFPEGNLPDYGTAYVNKRLLFFQNPANGKIYFRRYFDDPN